MSTKTTVKQISQVTNELDVIKNEQENLKKKMSHTSTITKEQLSTTEKQKE